MLLPKAKSQRANTPVEPGRVVLDTFYDNKQFRVWMTSKPSLQPDPTELGNTDQVHVAILANHHQITQSIGGILKKAQSGDTVVVVCHTPKAYQSALSFLGYQKNNTAG